MKTIWARVGMSVKVTDEEYEKLRKEAEYEINGQTLYGDIEDIPEWLMKKLEEEGEIDGETYIPQSVFEEEQ